MEFTARKPTLIVIFGGQSAEHDVSCVSAAHILRAADPTKYDTNAVGIASDGTWHLVELARTHDGGIDPTAVPDRLVAAGEPVSPAVLFDRSPDTEVIVFPVVHGPLGEDGTLQGLLELADVAYVGSGVLASSLAMDKAMAKTVFDRAGIPQVRHIALREDAIDESALASVVENLGLPVFVKPVNMGSSVGVSKATTVDALRDGVREALRHDQWVLFEEAVTGRELEVAVIGNLSPRASIIGEIEPAADFYDYDDKYTSDSAHLVVPAPLDEPTRSRIEELALSAYGALRCEGMARVDFFLPNDGRGPIVNEVNTIPGFTPISMYPKLWAESGLDSRSLIDELIALALERRGRQRRASSR